MNLVLIRGRLTADPKSRTAGSTTIAGFTIALNEKSKDGKETVKFFRCKFFGKQAENVVKWFTKGKEIIIEGALDQEKFQDKNGNDVEIVVIKGFRWEFVGGDKKKDDAPSAEDNAGGLW